MRGMAVRTSPTRSWAGLLAAGLGLWLAASLAMAWELTRRPRPPFPEPPPKLAGDLGYVELESVRLVTADGERLGAWFADGRPGAAGVVLLHGKDGTRSACLPAARMLLRAGRAVLAVSLRGHGDSSGERLDFGPRARADVIAAVAWLEQRRPGEPVVVRGTSLGGAAAAFAAVELDGRVHGWVLECLYTDLASAVHHRTARRLPPVLDRLAAWGLLAMAPLFDGGGGDHDVAGALSTWGRLRAGAPALILTGGADPLAPAHEAAALAAAAGGDVAVLPGAGHDRLHEPDPGAYGSLLLDLVQRAEAWARAPPITPEQGTQAPSGERP
jgi:alpha-beta hydrolase superfamily lysophospholipase